VQGSSPDGVVGVSPINKSPSSPLGEGEKPTKKGKGSIVATDHDRLFKELISTFFVEFIELFLPQVKDYLDPTSLIPLDKEVFTDVTSGEKHEADIVMQTRFQDKEAFFLIHVENQSSTDSTMGHRMFKYFSRLFEKYNYPVYPVVLFSYDLPARPEPDSFEIIFPDKKVLEFNYSVIQLNQLRWQDYLNRPNPVASALMAKMQVAPEDRVKVKLECLKMLIGLELDLARTQLLSGFVGMYLHLNKVEKAEFEEGLNTISPAVKEKAMELMTDWALEGREQGKVMGASSITLRLLKHKFGNLEPELEQQIQELEIASLEKLSIALLDFTQLSQLEEWLKQGQV